MKHCSTAMLSSLASLVADNILITLLHDSGVIL